MNYQWLTSRFCRVGDQDGRDCSGSPGADRRDEEGRQKTSLRAQLPDCWLVSTNQSHLSMPRAISVKMAAVSASFSSVACSLAYRPCLPNSVSVVERASM